MSFDIFDENHLSVLPQTAGKLLELANNEFATADELAAVIAQDPSVAARILGLAGSALYALREPPSSLTDAIVRVLGVDTTRGVTLGIVLNNAFDFKQCVSFDSHRFWQHSLYIGEINQRLAAASGNLSEAERCLAYVSGLASRIGLLAMASLEPERLSSLLEDANHESLTARLEQGFGTNHKKVAVQVAERWDLPDPIRTAYIHLSKAATSPADEFSVLTQLAVVLAESLLSGEDEPPQSVSATAREMGLEEALLSFYTRSEAMQEKIDHLCHAVA